MIGSLSLLLLFSFFPESYYVVVVVMKVCVYEDKQPQEAAEQDGQAPQSICASVLLSSLLLVDAHTNSVNWACRSLLMRDGRRKSA